MKLSCVILTRGTRPAELDRAVHSALDQDDADVEVVVVAQGADLPPQPPGVEVVRLRENVGIPAGRNRGVEASHGDVILFLDDDGWYDSRRVAAHVRDAFSRDFRLGVLSFRVCDPNNGGLAARRHVPRLRAGDPERSSEVTTFLGGACAVRRSLFELVGDLPDQFFYAHEETDFAWRVIDAGYRIWYDAHAVLCHPVVEPSRHTDFYRFNARNRVWLARRNLPWPLAAVYLFDWLVMTLLRERSVSALRAWLRGFGEGWRVSAGQRRPISWRTVWTMAKAGRPPVI
ncbi:MAG: glycosyltransferase [Streptosporangiales bacterium]|nr:glycosyltransferase [Streptosporangiales bacterium]